MSQFKHLPNLVVHADWGSDPRKRWMAQAVRQSDNTYLALPPELVGDLATLVLRLRKGARIDGSVFLGFDFPIGVCSAYAERAGVQNFLEWLPELGQGKWADFFDIAKRQDQISVHRPFYPFRPGGTSREHLVERLGVQSFSDLLRICERRTGTRGDACALFWTLGGNHVGRAAQIGWREVVIPALQARVRPALIWPFNGALGDLLAPQHFVMAETYPAEFYGHFGVTFPRGRVGEAHGKRVQADRKANADAFAARAQQLGVIVDPDLKTMIVDGFGPSPDGEDPFDAVVGLWGMLNILIGERPAGDLRVEKVQRVEGWILGQDYKAPKDSDML